MQQLLRVSLAIDRLNNRIGILLSWLVLIMVLIGIYNAVTRKLSLSIGVDLSSNMYIEAQWYMFSLVFLWAGAYALRNGAHVRVDILYSRISSKSKAWVDILGTLLFLLPLCLLIIWVSTPYALDSWRILENSPDPGGLPRYLVKSAIPVGFILLLLQGLSELVRNIAILRGVVISEEHNEVTPR
ncbi:MAG: TRAP transporter small permease subunit [Gammaproteobacteria bacterium]|nr:TRAP transporter small permease subunit [Gammaproteobacteria bacterium]MCP5408768.1 TRAP transporter small permease subunit [Chromatiaceae bacterium]MCP5442241.1 TRAP transporter small permease subunit [Chromatiaceae bacterium]